MLNKNEKIDVLDHGFVRLIDMMGDDLSVVRSARVSYDAAERTGEDEGSDKRLINYLMKNDHSTPFESVTVTFEVKAPLFVLRQWHRHRTQSYNELSARYRELPREFYIPDVATIGKQAKHNKQMRDVAAELTDDEIRNLERDIGTFRSTCDAAFDRYEFLLERGWPRELARSVLPVATYSHMFCTMNLLNMLKFCGLRCHEHAQHEIRVYARAMLELIRPNVPITISAWEKKYS